MMVSSSWMARTSSLILRWSIRIRATPCGESDSSRSRSCSTSNVGPSGSCSRCLMSLISSDLAGPPVDSVQRTTAQSSFDHGVPSIVPSKHLFRTQAIIETLLGSEKIRRPSEFFATFAGLLPNNMPAQAIRVLLAITELPRCSSGASGIAYTQPVSVSRLSAIPGAT